MDKIKVKTVSLVNRLLKPRGKYSFIHSIVKHGKVLDVGCGNNSPFIIKTLRPDLHYVGIDIGIYNQKTDGNQYADELIITDPGSFHSKIAEFKEEFDAVISSHNLEHCDDYMAVSLAMLQSLRKGGIIYIAFPSEESINFPSRPGTLNFYDDSTHRNIIEYDSFIEELESEGMNIVFAAKKFRPLIPFLTGLAFEPFGILLNRQAPVHGTWALYGFETVIIAEKQ